MNNVNFLNKAGALLGLVVIAASAAAQGGIASPPDKTRGATREPASGVTTGVVGPSTIAFAPKKTHKAVAKAKAASAAASN